MRVKTLRINQNYFHYICQIYYTRYHHQSSDNVSNRVHILFSVLVTRDLEKVHGVVFPTTLEKEMSPETHRRYYQYYHGSLFASFHTHELD